MNKPDVIADSVIERIQHYSAQIYRSDKELLERLRALSTEFGIRRVNRAHRQLRLERTWLRTVKRKT